MILKQFRVMVGNNNTYTNSYLVMDEITKEAILIDAPGAIDKIYNYIENANGELKSAILTHCHGDHIAGLAELKKCYPNVKIYIHESEKEAILDDSITLCSFLNIPVNTIKADYFLKEDDLVKFGNQSATIIHTPGHTKGSICILIGDALFSGDTMFKRTYGRTDLKTSSEEEMLSSIRDKLLKLPENTILYPGHGANSILREEKQFYHIKKG